MAVVLVDDSLPGRRAGRALRPGPTPAPRRAPGAAGRVGRLGGPRVGAGDPDRDGGRPHQLLRAQAVDPARRAVPPDGRGVRAGVVAQRGVEPARGRGRGRAAVGPGVRHQQPAHPQRRSRTRSATGTPTSAARCSTRTGSDRAEVRGVDAGAGRQDAASTRPTPRWSRRGACRRRWPRTSGSSTCSSSGLARPAWRPRCTRRPRGCSTLVVERESIGGQAGTSSLIRNYLGFSRGISGAELAQRGYQQAWVFGAHFVLMREVDRLVRRGPAVRRARRRRRRPCGAKAVVVATGVVLPAARGREPGGADRARASTTAPTSPRRTR